MEKTEKKFDAVAMMRQIRDAMSDEIAKMDHQEQKRYLNDRVHIGKQGEPAHKVEELSTKP